MLALYSMLLPPYYAQNYAGIIGSSLVSDKIQHGGFLKFIDPGVADCGFNVQVIMTLP